MFQQAIQAKSTTPSAEESFCVPQNMNLVGLQCVMLSSLLAAALHAHLVCALNKTFSAGLMDPCEELPTKPNASRLFYASPMLLTFQGSVLAADSQLPTPMVVHVLLKAKLLKTGSYLVRTVLYTQRATSIGTTYWLVEMEFMPD